MEQLVLEYSWGDMAASGISTVPFTWSSKEDFQMMVLEKIEDHKKSCVKEYGQEDGEKYYKNGLIKLFDDNLYIRIEDIEDNITQCVYTLSEWFNEKKYN